MVLESRKVLSHVEKKEPSYCWWECKLVQPLWRTVWRFLKKLNTELSYDPAIPILGISRENYNLKRYMHPTVHSSTMIAKTWKQPKCPSAD